MHQWLSGVIRTHHQSLTRSVWPDRAYFSPLHILHCPSLAHQAPDVQAQSGARAQSLDCSSLGLFKTPLYTLPEERASPSSKSFILSHNISPFLAHLTIHSWHFSWLPVQNPPSRLKWYLQTLGFFSASWCPKGSCREGSIAFLHSVLLALRLVSLNSSQVQRNRGQC